MSGWSMSIGRCRGKYVWEDGHRRHVEGRLLCNVWLFCAVYLMSCISGPAEDIPTGVIAFCPTHVTSCCLESDVHAKEGSDTGIPYSLTSPLVIQVYQHALFAGCFVTSASRDGAQHLPAYIRCPDSPAACTRPIFDVPYWRCPADADTFCAGECALDAKPIGEAGCACRIAAFVVCEVVIVICGTPGVCHPCYVWVCGHVP